MILIATAALWSGVLGIRMNADDFQYIHSMAPIRTLADVLRPFWSHDANPSFFRPLPNVTMALTYLWCGWSGFAFHLLNLVLHLATTWLSYHAARKLFRLSANESLWVMLCFGLLASHEYNLVVDTARADVLVALCGIGALLCEQRSREKKARSYKVAAVVLFLLALLSKEIAIMILPLFPIIAWREKGEASWQSLFSGFAPYVIAAALLYVYHSQFTAPFGSSQPLEAEGARSLMAMVRNAIYGLGYVVLPLDLEAATKILAQYKLLLMPLATVCVALIATVLGRSPERRIFVFPTIVLLLTASVVFLSFERWRLYLPSLPLIVIGVLIFTRIVRPRSASVRYGVTILLLVLGAYHITRSLEAQADWRASTTLFEHLRGDLTEILATHGSQTRAIEFIALPSKLGSATVMQLGQEDAVRQADMDRLHEDTFGSVEHSQLVSNTAVEVYALSRSEGYTGLSVSLVAPRTYRVSVPESSNMMLFPSGLEGNGVARRDMLATVGATISNEGSITRVRNIRQGVIKSVDVELTDTLALPLYFDGRSFRRM